MKVDFAYFLINGEFLIFIANNVVTSLSRSRTKVEVIHGDMTTRDHRSLSRTKGLDTRDQTAALQSSWSLESLVSKKFD